MRYLLLIAVPEGEDASDAEPPGCGTWSEDTERLGVMRGTSQLRPSREATTVRVRGERVVLSDGPFTESKEVIAGYALIECASLDEAVEVAAQHPVAGYGAVEIRPLLERPAPANAHG
ncbi:YciI family protein [Georgenia sp. SYP-B2076]|uniref:YciI family protein n=1 Tax=Georgenia sp. SYP-B2076 TaxID=2495881 RepID=UPI000F8EA00D|nr:YciI family protein [Georgenia sp. SYP-B2076]